MGTKLINRNSKNYIELTENGKELFEGYEKAYNLLFITEKTYLQNKTLNTGKIKILDDNKMADSRKDSVGKVC